jgi:L-asparagine transporter-like permease
MPCLLCGKVAQWPRLRVQDAASVTWESGLGVRIAWTIVALIIIGAAVSAVFRAATLPDRARERRDMAKEVCLKSGGEWVLDKGQREVCKRA